MSKRDEKRHRYAALMLAHRQEWQRYAHNQTKRAINKDKSVVRTAFASTSSPDAAMKRIEAYHKGPSIKVWENVFKAVWLETGHAAAEFMHEYLTGKSVNLTADIQHKGEGIRTLVWKDPVVDTVLSSWDSRVDDKIMNGGFLDKIEGINSTTQDNIHRTIQEGVANGEGHYTIGQNVESHLDETWAKRGETISRTETNSAMNAATREDMKATAPDLWKTWSIAGNNTRPWHEEMDGESIPQDEMFIVDGEEMEGPGDDSASPGNVINCECTQLAEEPPAGTPVSDEEQARIDEAALAEEGATAEGQETFTDYNDAMNSFNEYISDNSTWQDARDSWIGEYSEYNALLINPTDADPNALARLNDPAIKELFTNRVAALQDLIENGPGYSGDTFRGIAPKTLEEYNKLSSLQAGKIFTEERFMASSTDLEFADSWASYQATSTEYTTEGMNRVIFSIKDTKGVAIDVSEDARQKEILSSPGTQLRITNVFEEKTETENFYGVKYTKRDLTIEAEMI